MIKLTIEKAANAKGITSQKALKELILEKTGIEMRSATISDLYRNNKNQINREHLFTVMEALGITDFNEVLEIDKNWIYLLDFLIVLRLDSTFCIWRCDYEIQ